MSWRPRGRDGVTYQIRRLSDGSEWWIGVVYLRRLREAQSDPEAELHAPPVPERR
jgi:hypothetical protein